MITRLIQLLHVMTWLIMMNMAVVHWNINKELTGALTVPDGGHERGHSTGLPHTAGGTPALSDPNCRRWTKATTADACLCRPSPCRHSCTHLTRKEVMTVWCLFRQMTVYWNVGIRKVREVDLWNMLSEFVEMQMTCLGSLICQHKQQVLVNV